MKRQSKAEEALRKQVKQIISRINEIDVTICELRKQREIAMEIIDQLEKEITTLYNARVDASKRMGN